ncbi:Uma2 family endonuclease [Novosphingopyxis sp.]|uniref:Uma2 family endonuclease n=1 Tax=Novosphingopyxis sp. TaxID=2709690 RepID=UPI003B58F031
MNIHTSVAERKRLKLKVDDFLLLKREGMFSDYIKSELLDGELFGNRRVEDESLQTDAIERIKLNIEDYELLARDGSIGRGSRTELIDGEVYSLSPQYRPHGFMKDELAYRLRRAIEDLGSPLHVATEQSMAAGRFSEPQPDIMLTSEPRGEGPIPSSSVALVCEISDSTVAFDLGEKAGLYSGANIPEYWVVDLNGDTLHQFWAPGVDGYAERREVALGEPMEAVTINGLAVVTGDI